MKVHKVGFMSAAIVLTVGFFMSCRNGTENRNAYGAECDGLELLESVSDVHFAFVPMGVYMSALNYDDGILSVSISNQSGKPISYGGEYYLQKLSGDEWIDLRLPEGYVFTEGVKRLGDLDESTESYDISVFGKLGPGKYRLKKTGIDATFTLVEKR